MWDLNNADDEDKNMNIEEEDLENVTPTTINSNSIIQLLDDDNTSSFTTYNFDIMSTTTTSTNNVYTNDVVLSSSARSTTAATDWLNLSSSFPAGSAAGLRPMSSSLTLLNYDQQQQQPMAPVNKKSRRGPRSRSSQYRGVTFYRRTGRWESHIWDCGKQVYLGGFDTAHAAARAYDRAAIKFRGTDADINFNIADYQEDIGHMKNMSKEEFVLILRRQTTGFARGTSKYRGVTLHMCGRWEARMGQLLGKKAYDVAAFRCNGSEAATNFERSTFDGDLASLANKSDGKTSGHDLELSLNIRSSSEYNLKLNDASSSKAWNDPKLVYSTSAAGKSQIPTPYGQPSTSNNYPAMSQGLAKHSDGYFPMSYEVHSTVATSSSRMPDCGWQHPKGHDSTTSTGPPPFSIAASSGFSLPSYATPTTSITQQARQSYPYQNYYSRP